jgi:hypothetical protein
LDWPLELADWFYVMFKLALDCRFLPNRCGDALPYSLAPPTAVL